MFQSGKQLISFFEKQKSKADNRLLGFTVKLFEALKAANPGRQEKIVTAEQKILDTLARLLVGDETCTAIAISGDRLLLATNKHSHIDDHITYQSSFEVLEKYPGIRYVLRFKGVIKYSDRSGLVRTINEKSDPVIYQLYAAEQTFKVIQGDPVIRFTQDEHKIPFPHNNSMTISIPISLKQEAQIFNIVDHCELNKEYELFQEIPLELDPLKRRATKLIMNIAAIAHSILTRPDMEGDVLEYMEKNKNWIQFLNDSLSYEVATRSVYKGYIDPYNSSDQGDPGMHAMLQFYEWLVEDYQQFKWKFNERTSVKSIQAWFRLISENIQNDSVPAPHFIKQNPIQFLERASMYFRDLVLVEDFVANDARRNGKLSMLLVRESLFKRSVTIQVIDGIPEQHAEIRLLEQHLLRNRTTDGYYGITMLYCALCNFTMRNLNVANFRGTHGTLYPKWVLIDIIKQSFLQQFLGDVLYRDQQAFADSDICYHPDAKPIPKNSKKQSEVALMLFSAIGFINNLRAFNQLGIDQQLLLPGLAGLDLYPEEKDQQIFDQPDLDQHSLVAIEGEFSLQTEQMFKKALVNMFKLSSPIGNLIKKYKLKDDSQIELERGLRNAAANNRLDDLKIFIQKVQNINAKDAKTGKTALYWAVFKNNLECVRELLSAGADPRIEDNDQRKPANYTTSEEILRLLNTRSLGLREHSQVY